jgi:Tol biopolymer transport system component
MRKIHRSAYPLGAALPLALVAAACAAPQSAVQPAPAAAAEPTTRTISFTTDECTYCAFDISPDGRCIVFDLLGQLWRIPAEGGEAVALTDAVADQAEDLDPNFSPDGRWIVFQSDRPGGSGLWILSAEGGAPRMLSGTESASRRASLDPYTLATWSSDGERLAFMHRTLRQATLHIHDLEDGGTAPLALDEAINGRLRGVAWLPGDRLLIQMSPATDSAGALWLVDTETGVGEELPLGRKLRHGLAPSPDGARLAYFGPDEEGQLQLWLQPLAGGEPRQLTRQRDVVPLRARWTAAGDEILYSAAGRLWAVSESGGPPREIRFLARVEFERHEPALPAVRFPEPGEAVPVRGHKGAVLSPDGGRIALIALGQLWVWPVDGEPQAVAELPASAAHPSWSPDAAAIAWSAGWSGGEDLFVTDLATGSSRPLTALPGYAARPSWSPDGGHIAFIYWPAPESTDLREPPRFAVMPAGAALVREASALLHLPEITFDWLLEPFAMGQEVPVWSPDSDALLYHARSGEAQLLRLDGEVLPHRYVEGWTTFVHWVADSSLVYVQGNQLWRAELRGDSVERPVLLADEAALYPSVARDGTVLYMAAEGYRLRRPDGSLQALGWPLSFRVPAPAPLLIRRARIIDGTRVAPDGHSDVLVEHGRIARIGPAGSIGQRPGMQVLEADGRTLIPGLIDLHVHMWDYAAYAASLYHGATTVREMGAPMARAAGLAEAAAAGIHPGARVILGGAQVVPGFPADYRRTGAAAQFVSAEDLERVLTVAQMFGASYVKMYVPGTWSAGAELVRAAHARGMRIGGHCAHPLPLIAAGIAQVEHVIDCLPRSGVQPRADLLRLYHGAGVAIVPSVSFWSHFRRRSTEPGLLPTAPGIRPFLSPFLRWWGGWRDDDSVQEASPESTEELAARAAVRAARSQGIAIAAGSDAVTLPGGIHLELEELVAAGLTPMEALVAATSTAARVLGAQDEIGTIEVGKRADLVLLDTDPLEDIRNTRRIWKVIQGGQVVDREGLLEWARENQQSGGQQ